VSDPGSLIPPSGTVPVFPLPNAVFYPGTVLPLHVFEPRYRAMVRDAAAGEELICVSLLMPGWDKCYEGSPPYHEVGTVGRLKNVQPLPDGRFLLQLLGLQRVRLGPVVQESPYRIAECHPIPEPPVEESDPAVRDAKLELLATQSQLAREMTDGPEPTILLDETVSFVAAVNGACATLPVEPAVRQALLEESDLMSRQRRVQALLEALLEGLLRSRLVDPDEDSPRFELN
jgi:Lon protease-like protein